MYWCSCWGPRAALWGAVRPLGRLAEATNKLRKGQSGVRVDVTSRDEVGALADAFNGMTAAVEDREAKLAVIRAKPWGNRIVGSRLVRRRRRARSRPGNLGVNGFV